MAAYTIPSAAAVLVTFIGEVQAELETSVQSEVAAASPSVLDVVKISNADGLAKTASECYDTIVSVSVAQDAHTQAILFEYVRVLKAGGQVVLREPLVGRTFDMSERVSAALTLAGFVETKIGNANEHVVFVSKKPSWNVQSTQGISIKKKAPVPASVWSVDSDDIIDEASLLSEEDRLKPVLKADDCEVGATKKACKNCTCGRADEEVGATKKKLTLEMIENPGVNSGCGSCSLGDAYRCGGCPYRGLPSFKPGEKITLPDDFSLDDVLAQ